MSFFRRKPKHVATAAPVETAAPVAVLDRGSITGDYTVDASHSRLGFSARHAMVTTVRGQFADFEGTAHVDAENPAASTVTLDIRPASVSTGTADRDGHLVSGDFFDVENHPAITFVSTSVERDGAEWSITGDLTIKGVSHSVTIPFEETGTAVDPFGNTRVGFEGETTINRKDWDLSWNAALETGGVLVSEKIKLQFDISAIKNA
ncbi:Polyisoprenoid-binding protein YceI [Nocardioides exalbidus]|uniref:Polyisoprenoid-binding protein YceI n=1 Tax=Nocardioides exalbidus TaxID=402596 RepID=A0A1H4WIX4_9ACTN|nr:YceI family protein [Nocardioides exalbidus]SEC93247.1 Polyisoprenoid-binding protein YceI [Nocardioides exalbidus]